MHRTSIIIDANQHLDNYFGNLPNLKSNINCFPAEGKAQHNIEAEKLNDQMPPPSQPILLNNKSKLLFI